jgi:hypothetical protein
MGKAILECRNVGMLEYRNIGMLEYRNVGISECWNIGMVEYRNNGMSEYRNVGMAECRNHQVSPWGKQYWNVGIIRWAYGEINMRMSESSGGPMGKQIWECWNVRIIR